MAAFTSALVLLDISRRKGDGSIDDRKITEEKEIRTLSQLMDMDNESTTEENSTADGPICDEPSGHMTIFLFPAIMEIRQHRAKVVTIGPYHHKEELFFGNNYKWQVLDMMNDAFQFETAMFFRSMVRREKELRGCYEEQCEEDSYPMDTKEFLQMMLLDGCFIIFALKCFSWKNQPLLDMVELFTSKNSKTRRRWRIRYHFLFFKSCCMFVPALRDFVGCSMKDLALSGFKCVHPKMNKEKSDPPKDFLHLLDVFHWSRVPKDKYKIDNRFDSHTLSDLCMLHAPDSHRTRMKFRKKSGSSLDVELKNSSCRKSCVVKIPTIDIKNYQFSVFESLVTFEARYKKRGFCFTAFVESMASILGSENDVKLLQKSGIIPKGTEASDDYVIKFFHQLCRCIKPIAGTPRPCDGYKNAVDHVRETVRSFRSNRGQMLGSDFKISFLGGPFLSSSFFNFHLLRITENLFHFSP
ncbi:UPF0481 protein At3g47200-like [Carex rostrata]